MFRILVIFCLLVLVGCAPPTSLKPDAIARIQKIGLITRVADDDLAIFDHTGTPKNSFKPCLDARAIRESILGGGSNQVKANLAPKTIQQDLESEIIDKLSKNFQIVKPDYFQKRKLTEWFKKYCLEEAKHIGVDTLIFLDYGYGLAAFPDKPATVSIEGQVIVYDVKAAKIILKKNIESGQERRTFRTIDELAKEDSSLFIDDLNGAMENFSSYLARDFGIGR